MSDPTKIALDDVYEEMAASYQCLEIHYLNEALIGNGLTDRVARMAICRDYQSTLGAVRDQFWIEAAGVRVYPVMAFSTEFTGDTETRDRLGPSIGGRWALRSASTPTRTSSTSSMSRVSGWQMCRTDR